MNKIQIEGMHCQNCVAAIKEALEALPGAKGVSVDLATGEARWEAMGVEMPKVKEAIEDIGFGVACEEKSCCCCHHK